LSKDISAERVTPEQPSMSIAIDNSLKSHAGALGFAAGAAIGVITWPASAPAVVDFPRCFQATMSLGGIAAGCLGIIFVLILLAQGQPIIKRLNELNRYELLLRYLIVAAWTNLALIIVSVFAIVTVYPDSTDMISRIALWLWCGMSGAALASVLRILSTLPALLKEVRD
jgi:hypothetical protein